MAVDTPHLDRVDWPRDLRDMSVNELKQVAEELRAEMVDAVSTTGGHLGAGLGVIELTVALHHLFDTPEDILIWDVGHQCYPHKILTGRRDRIRTIRQGGGLSGFTKRSESEYDPFGAAHASTSVSAGLGFAVGRDLQGRKNRVVAVIGDGALTGGMAYEGLNHAGSLDSRLIVILNDNDMSIAPPGRRDERLPVAADLVQELSQPARRRPSHRRTVPARRGARREAGGGIRPLGLVTGGTLFEELGFFYVGPVDGHNLDHLLPVLRNVRDDQAEGPDPGPCRLP